MSTESKRPNIVCIFADDWGRYASCYAGKPGASKLNNFINTPHIDRIAKQGALFHNAVVPAPSCTPCRSSVLSGRYFWQTRLGAILQGAVWDQDIPSYPLLLEQAGYHIGFSDKVWGPGIPADAPHGGSERAYNGHGRAFNNCSLEVEDRLQTGMTVADAHGVMLAQVHGNVQDFLQARPDGDTPFCYWWGPTNTHRRWQQGSGLKHWGLNPDDLEGSLPACLPDVHEVREDVADYLGECQAFDAGVGVLLEELEACGELDNTLIVISGDHGIPGFPRAKCNLYDIGCEVSLMVRMPGGGHGGRHIDDMVNIMDLAPTFLEAAGLPVDPGMSGRSLWPLLQGDASGHIDTARQWVITGRERHVAEARDLNLPYPQRAIRTKDFLYIKNFAPDRWPVGDPKGLDNSDAPAPDYDELCINTRLAYADCDAGPCKAWMIHHRGEAAYQQQFNLGFAKRPAEELYDLRSDPEQMNNVAGQSDYAETLSYLSQQLHQELVKQQDPRAIDGDHCRFEQSPYTDFIAGNRWNDLDPWGRLARS